LAAVGFLRRGIGALEERRVCLRMMQSNGFD
jgi:hypothetical protein